MTEHHPGKTRGLRALSDAGVLTIAALDHRRSFAAFYGGILGHDGVRGLKQHLLDTFRPWASGALLDPDYGIGLDHGAAGLIFTLERPGFAQRDGYAVSELRSGWSVAQAAQLGASGVKLLVQIDPQVPESVAASRELALRVADECVEHDVVFLFEPIVPADAPDRGLLGLRALELLADVNADVFKVEFPGADLVGEVAAIVDRPWAMLSGGADFTSFERALDLACAAGCSGFVAGRSIWQEIRDLPDPAQRNEFIATTAAPRFERLAAIARRSAKPLWDSVPA
ncbi:hypothetical protein [Lentzea sp. NPDC051838]|uniref:hypothetical protein n=1 Tax=Lentzea sp. NPDC051838 TaxID=3154849 RepID=UPI003449A5FD